MYLVLLGFVTPFMMDLGDISHQETNSSRLATEGNENQRTILGGLISYHQQDIFDPHSASIATMTRLFI